MLQAQLFSVALAAVLMMYWRHTHPTLTEQGGDYQVEKKKALEGPVSKQCIF